ncbi:hypothetical protein psageK4_138c [Pseudomonas phage psageK4]|uniref:Uncharacterized protein n=1 Tax=Pseudomonas phage psageK4 TaxID=2859563 RepID=A0ABX8SMG7_9CAUD|nr:hypothetical protein QGX14_gp097 [Pseudomonas phage psageK4]QXV71792.1 hypothetical protein psageK4_138c [Pseudomonas phage psageK4]
MIPRAHPIVNTQPAIISIIYSPQVLLMIQHLCQTSQVRSCKQRSGLRACPVCGEVYHPCPASSSVQRIYSSQLQISFMLVTHLEAPSVLDTFHRTPCVHRNPIMNVNVPLVNPIPYSLPDCYREACATHPNLTFIEGWAIWTVKLLCSVHEKALKALAMRAILQTYGGPSSPFWYESKAIRVTA